MTWQKYKIAKRLIRKEPVISFYTSRVIHFNCALVKEYLKGVIEIIVYYDLDNHLISFVPSREKMNGFKLSKKGKGKVIAGSGICRKLNLNLEKSLSFSPMRDPKTEWLVVNYTHPLEERENKRTIREDEKKSEGGI